MNAQEIGFNVSGAGDPVGVSGILLLPDDAWCLYLLAHGAGAGMRHPFMEEVAQRLAGVGIGSFRYQFPYMEQGKRRPDHRNKLMATVTSAAVASTQLAPGLPLVAGGKSMGGRMTSLTASMDALPTAVGLVFLGFPLHPPGREGTERAGHLADVAIPMLFVQGTRDAFARPDLIEGVTGQLPGSELHWVEGGDHSFRVLKRSGRTQDEIMGEIVGKMRGWIGGLV